MATNQHASSAKEPACWFVAIRHQLTDSPTKSLIHQQARSLAVGFPLVDDRPTRPRTVPSGIAPAVAPLRDGRRGIGMIVVLLALEHASAVGAVAAMRRG